ncbi:hypothetical protein BC830DRAFT_1125780 [Chytriomyces sp. MP71]|nr:hypothetical protein BC830DRAFT_1125780 [Chytriomyces sp. MP71]
MFARLKNPEKAFAHRHYFALHPACNMILAKRWEDKSMQLHHKRLRQAKPSIDNLRPRVYPHLEMRLKGVQIEEERLHDIERKNHILLDRISFQMLNPAEVSSLHIHKEEETSSLMMDARDHKRKRDKEKITRENLIILQRIEDKAPNYNRCEWSNERRKNLEHLANIAKYPTHYMKILEEYSEQFPPGHKLTGYHVAKSAPAGSNQMGLDDYHFSHAPRVAPQTAAASGSVKPKKASEVSGQAMTTTAPDARVVAEDNQTTSTHSERPATSPPRLLSNAQLPISPRPQSAANDAESNELKESEQTHSMTEAIASGGLTSTSIQASDYNFNDYEEFHSKPHSKADSEHDILHAAEAIPVSKIDSNTASFIDPELSPPNAVSKTPKKGDIAPKASSKSSSAFNMASSKAASRVASHSNLSQEAKQSRSNDSIYMKDIIQPMSALSSNPSPQKGPLAQIKAQGDSKSIKSKQASQSKLPQEFSEAPLSISNRGSRSNLIGSNRASYSKLHQEASDGPSATLSHRASEITLTHKLPDVVASHRESRTKLQQETYGETQPSVSYRASRTTLTRQASEVPHTPIRQGNLPQGAQHHAISTRASRASLMQNSQESASVSKRASLTNLNPIGTTTSQRASHTSLLQKSSEISASKHASRASLFQRASHAKLIRETNTSDPDPKTMSNKGSVASISKHNVYHSQRGSRHSLHDLEVSNDAKQEEHYEYESDYDHIASHEALQTEIEPTGISAIDSRTNLRMSHVSLKQRLEPKQSQQEPELPQHV